MEKYDVTSKIILAVLAYGATWSLVKFGKMKLLTHRRIWNIFLLIIFLVSCILGLLAAYLIDHGQIPSWYMIILRLHVIAGIFMTVIGLFHTFWHIKYFISIFKKKN